MILFTQGRNAIYNFDDVSRIHITGNGTGIQAVTRSGAGGGLANYKNSEQALFVIGMLEAAISSDEKSFTFPTETEVRYRSQHGSSGGGNRHGGS